MIDTKLISRCLNNDSKAQYELYKLLYVKFMGLCMRYRGDKDAATISLNNGFVKILKNLHKLEDVNTFYGWVKKILINEMLTVLAKEQKNKERNIALENTAISDLGTSSNEGMENLIAEDLRALLLKLPNTTRSVFNLFAIDGFSHKEIADKLDISTGTSKWHVSEARKRLKELIVKMNVKPIVNVR